MDAAPAVTNWLDNQDSSVKPDAFGANPCRKKMGDTKDIRRHQEVRKETASEVCLLLLNQSVSGKPHLLVPASTTITYYACC